MTSASPPRRALRTPLSSGRVVEHIEREFKLRIPDEAAWAALLGCLAGPVAPPVLQINHFFDTATGALRRARLALRLRSETPRGGTGVFALTLKGPLLASHPALAVRPEEELALAESEARGILSGARSPLEVLRASGLGDRALVRQGLELVGQDPLLHLGAFENERTRVGPVPVAHGSSALPLVFELDCTRFPDGRIERELELELPPEAEPGVVERALAGLFSRIGVPLEPVPSKASRFFRSLDAPPGALRG